jgi:hypothetical protein
MIEHLTPYFSFSVNLKQPHAAFVFSVDTKVNIEERWATLENQKNYFREKLNFLLNP